MEFRIGINLGDVIIAERLQQLADNGGIAISATAYDQVKTKIPVGFEFTGEQRVKNIAEPVRDTWR
jgi:adenylate cyclase